MPDCYAPTTPEMHRIEGKNMAKDMATISKGKVSKYSIKKPSVKAPLLPV